MAIVPRTTPEFCTHALRERRRYPIAGGGFQLTDQCQNPLCGERVGGSLPQKNVDMDAVPLFDLEARDHARVCVEVERQKTRERDFIEGRPELSPEYLEYLQTPEWRVLHDRVMKRAGGVCEACRRDPRDGYRPVNAHHLTYRHIFHEFLFELVAICRDCHDRWHERGRYAPPDEWEQTG